MLMVIMMMMNFTFRLYGPRCGGCLETVSPRDLVRKAREKVDIGHPIRVPFNNTSLPSPLSLLMPLVYPIVPPSPSPLLLNDANSCDQSIADNVLITIIMTRCSIFGASRAQSATSSSPQGRSSTSWTRSQTHILITRC